MLLHRFEQCGLGLRRRTVDLVGEHYVGKHGAAHETELAVLVEDFAAGDVGRHKVGGELYAVEGESEGLRQGVYHKGLRQSGNANQQAVAVGEHGGEQALHRFLLSNNYFAHLGSEPAVAFYQ